MNRSVFIVLLSATLSGCVGSSASERFVRTAPPPQTPAQTSSQTQVPAREAFVAPRVQQGNGLDSIIGASANTLTARFGAPRLNRIEGDARKLQFVGEGCVLDIYLYPLQAGGAPVATHVEARAQQGGGVIDRARCIAALTR